MPVRKPAGKKLVKKAATKTVEPVVDTPVHRKGAVPPKPPRKRTPVGVALKNLQEKERKQQYQIKAFDLRCLGVSYRVIAEVITEKHGYPVSHTTVKKWVDDELESRIEAPSKRLRQMEIERLDRYRYQLDQRALAGDLNAISIALKVMERYAKLTGLDAPQQIEMETKVVQPPDAVMERLLKAQQEIAEQEAALLGGGDDTDDNSTADADVPPAS